MRSGEFIVPRDGEWIDSLGVAPEPLDAHMEVMCVQYESSSGGAMTLTFGTANSVRMLWRVDGAILVDVTREGARRISTASGGGEAWVSIEFEVEELSGELKIKLEPDFKIEDVMLFS